MQFPDQDIYVAVVFPLVMKMDVENMPPDPVEVRSRIGTELNRVAKAGIITKTFQGGGNVPNRYRLAPEVQKG